MKSICLLPAVLAAAILAGLFLALVTFIVCAVVVPILASVALIRIFVAEPLKNIAYA